MHIARLTLVIAFAIRSAAVPAVTPPRLPFFHWDACPFECCQYGNWTATTAVKVLRERNMAAATAFTVEPGEAVRAVTGVIVTRRLGVIRFLQPITFDTPPFNQFTPGEIVYILHHEGAAYDYVWIKGKAQSEEIYASDVTPPGSNGAWRVESLPEVDWWVKIKNANGQAGWVLNPEPFRGMSSCD